jgi:hypothetical protein
MSTFTFPLNPTDGEIFTLPDGNDVQWNSYAWVPVTETVTYPLEIALGGTSAATVPEAQTNLVIGLTTINDDPPATPKYGDRWIRPEDMVEFVWVPNANTAGNWISPFDTSSSGGGSEITYPITVALGGTGADTPQQALTNLGGVGEAPAGPIIYGRNNGIWVEIPSGGSGVSVGDTPPVDSVQFPLWWDSTNLQLFVWYEDADSSQWVVANSTPGGSTGIEEAPEDGLQYARQDAMWTEITGGGAGGGVFIGDIPPTDPAQYPLWWDSTNLHLFIWYDDGTSAQWVDTTPASGGVKGELPAADGTVAAPGIAWAAELTSGWYRPSAARVGYAIAGKDSLTLDASTNATELTVYPKAASLFSQLTLQDQPSGTTDNMTQLCFNNSVNNYSISEIIYGDVPAKSLVFAFTGGTRFSASPVSFANGTRLKPAISWVSAPDTGWYKPNANDMSYAYAGKEIYNLSSGSGDYTELALCPEVSGSSQIALYDKNRNNPTGNSLVVNVGQNGVISFNSYSPTFTDYPMSFSAPGFTFNGPITGISDLGITGAVTVNNGGVALNKPTGDAYNIIYGRTAGLDRWLIIPGDAAAESGANAGSNFFIQRYADDGSYLGASFIIDRATGNVTAQGLTTTVETAVLQASLDAVIEETTARADQLQVDLDEIRLHADELQATVDDLKSSLHSALARIAALEKKK